MWDRLYRVTAPAALPVSVADAKTHLRVDHATDDALIQRLIEAAVGAIDGPPGIGIAMVSQVWRLSLDSFPCSVIELPLGPVLTVDSITYVDTAGATQTLPSGDYQTDITRNPARIAPAYGKFFPSTRLGLNAVKVQFTAGFGAASAVPSDLKSAILLIVGNLYTNRDATVLGAAVAQLPMGVDAILDRYRVGQAA